MSRNRRADLVAVIFLFLLPLIWFWPVVFGDRTLLPADNLYAFEPWQSFAEAQGVALPHNELLNDLVLENYPWKLLIREAIQRQELPLWNPTILAGVPFLAAGQHSALYPASLITYVLPLPRAYGGFTWLHLALAGWSMYVFGRVLRFRPLAALVAAVTFAYSLFFIVSVVFPMVIAAATWLPLLLASIEIIIRKQESKGNTAYSPIPYVVLGSIALGLVLLAGHPELTYYTLLVAGFYAAWRLVLCWREVGHWRPPLRLAGWLLAMVLLGLGLGMVQFLPLTELVRSNFREGSVTFEQVMGWAYPSRQLLTFVMPDFFGNPTHHGYWDIVAREWIPATVNALGESNHTIFWGIKNYVEAGSYLGLLPLILAALAVLTALRNGWRRCVAIFSSLALVSLAFIFGTPLYAILYYGLPGFSQLHSPFRWVFPYTLSMAVLAGVGMQVLLSHAEAVRSRFSWTAVLGIVASVAGLGIVALVGISLLVPSPFIRLGEGVLSTSEQARAAFADGRMFWHYEAINLLKFGVLSLLSGGALLWAFRRRRGWGLLLLAIILLDLWLYGHGFNPAARQEWLSFRPPVVDFLQQDGEPWRFTTFILPGEKTFNANVGMFYGFQDIRGYDSIIPRDYAAYMEQIETQDELLYNRIAPISDLASLESPLFQLLGVRYIITTQTLDAPGLTLVYDNEVRVYRNERAFSRAFVVHQAVIVPASQVMETLKAVNLAETVVLPSPDAGERQILGTPPDPDSQATIEQYELNEVTLSVSLPMPGWLVLTDSYFEGWRAFVRQADEAEETEVPILKADGIFRAVQLEAGETTVRFKYSPDSVKIGMYATFVAALALLLLLCGWAWGRFYREEATEEDVRRVAKNSLIPMGASLLNKGMDFAFALLRLRILTPLGEGSYTTAIVFIGYFEIFVRFGLGTLLTRDVASDRSQSNRYFANTLVLRTLLLLLSLPVMALALLAYTKFGNLSREELTAIGLFTVGLFFGNVADAASATFNAYEKMEYPAGVSVTSALGKVMLGAAVLLLGWGFVGLAAVSVVTNAVQAGWLLMLMRRRLFHPRWEVDTSFQRQMLSTSFPLMINHFLATIFFRVDVLLLRPMKGVATVGLYGAAYKYIDGLNVIPSAFTLAIFPLISRLAHTRRDSLLRAYILSLRLLLMVSLPIAVATTFIARPLILILGGSQYLPDSRIALQILIWSIPIGFVNSVTQYLLIALDQQRFLTRAFVIGVLFNVIANLLLIPRYSYRAAAVTTIVSELALLIPFYYGVRRHLAPIPWHRILARPLLATVVMAVTMYLLASVSLLLALVVGGMVYLAVLILSGALRDPDLAMAIARIVPLAAIRARLASGEVGAPPD